MRLEGDIDFFEIHINLLNNQKLLFLQPQNLAG